MCMQPIFVKSGRIFTSNDVHCTAEVASTRSGNERGVNRSKLSGKVKAGLKSRSDPVVFEPNLGGMELPDELYVQYYDIDQRKTWYNPPW